MPVELRSSRATHLVEQRDREEKRRGEEGEGGERGVVCVGLEDGVGRWVGVEEGERSEEGGGVGGMRRPLGGFFPRKF